MAEQVAVPSAAPLASVPGVELVQTGQWNISTGVVTFTRADLAAAVGALDCPAVRRPVLKIGHEDPRFDGEPCVGWVANMGLADDGNTIIGDYTGMPGWLGDVIASAYPDRSIEGCFDFRCQIGHTHPFVISAVALLGVTAPGVGTLQSLQDVAALYGVAASDSARAGGTPVAVTIHAAHHAAHPEGETTMPNPRPAQVAAGVTSEDVRRDYYEQAPWNEWICEMQLDPLQLIVVDDDTGKHYRVPVTINGEEFTFGDKVEVKVQYVDVPAGGTAAASSAGSGFTFVWASRSESRPGPRPVPQVVAGAIPAHKTECDAGPWSGAAAQKALPNSDGEATYRQAYAWVDSEANPDTKAAYRFIHHDVADDGTVGAANTAACSAAIGVLNGGRGGTTIPDGDVKGVYEHLAAHLADAGLTAPELQASAGHGTPPTSRTPSAGASIPPAPSGTNPKEGAAMDAAMLREALGLDPGASDDEVRAALADSGMTAPAGTGPQGDTQPGTEPGQDKKDEPAGDAPAETQPEAEPVSAARKTPTGPAADTVTVDRAAWEELRAAAEDGRTARQLQRTQERDQVLDEAVKAGKFPPARRAHWEAYWTADEEGARQALASLAPGLVPLEDSGAPGGEDTGEDTEFDSLFPPTAALKG